LKSIPRPPSGGASAGFAEPVAIVGMGGVFPGASSLDDFWRLIEEGRDTCREVPAGRWLLDPAAIRSTVPGAPDAVLTTRGCFIEDPSLDGGLDPMFQILLRAGQAAFAQARVADRQRGKVGIVLGNIALPTAGVSALCDEILLPLYERKVFGRAVFAGARHKPALATDPRNRYVTGLPAALLARSLGLGGACYTLDAACASSLYAVKLACDELLAHRAPAMLAGGLSRPDSLYTQMGFSQLRALSPSGRCSPFDAKGDGLIVGEGAGVVVLKRLSDALRDGDRIHALVRGIGLSNDLEGKLLQPSSEGQLRALRMAYAQAGWTPQMVDLIECHATGTPIGDAVEFDSLARLWEGGQWNGAPCVLSAVKSNIGHLLTAAGSAGLIKTLLAMRHGILPPVANFERPSEKVHLAGSPFAVLREARPWERRAPGVPRRAAVNGFGFGGINAHLLIEEWLGDAAAPAVPAVAPRNPAPEPVAVVGMAARVGRWPGLDAFRARVLYGEGEEAPAERRQWRGLAGAEIRAAWDRDFPGHYLDDLSVPVGRFHIAPRELAEMLPQQLLMLEAAKSALEDAGNPKLDASRSGVFIGLGLDLRTTDFHFRWAIRRRAAEWAREAGLDPDAAAAARWMAELCDGAGPPLDADRTLGALGGIVASRIAREFHLGGPSHGISSEESSGLRALQVAVRALQANELELVLAGAVDLAGDLRTLLATDALRVPGEAAVPGEGAACVVLKRLADARRDGDRIYAVIPNLDAATPPGAQPIEPADVDVGHTGAASGLVSFVKASLCLHHEVVPGGRDGGAPRYWLRDRADGPRRASVSSTGAAGERLHVVLEGVEDGSIRPSRALPKVSISLPETPRNSAGRVAFVFPGSGNQFAGMGRELALQWPEVLRRQDGENARLASQMHADKFWDGPLTAETLADHRALICAQVGFGAMLADLAMHFGIRPDAAIGYSLGESTALLALRAWRERDAMLERLSRSSLFATDLAGGPEWATGMVDRSAQAVRAAIGGRKQVYLLISNAPDECVIGGMRGPLEEVVAALGCRWFPLQGISTVHCELAHPVRRAYRELHRFEATPPPGVEFYSCAWGRAYVPDRESAADALEAQAMDTIDFPRVIRAAYDAGVRTFIEVGPGNSCSRMIDKILADKPHLARSLAVPGPAPVAQFLRTLAELHAAGVPMNEGMLRSTLAPARVPAAVPAPPGRHVTVPVTGTPLAAPALPAPASADHPRTDDFDEALYRSMLQAERATVEAHEAYLKFSENLSQTLAQAIATQARLLEKAAPSDIAVSEAPFPVRSLDRAACLEFARGSVGRVLGPQFAAADAFATRVRLPDEPLMLVDRILQIEGEPLSMTHGRVVTEHDIRAGAWYLDGGRIPTCIAVEAGQADLFLSGFLGIDFQTRGRSMYRLLDARVCFHRGLPGAGEVIRYDIRIDHFFRQGDAWLFRFGFEATVNGAPLLTMTEGCAGFFSSEALAAGKGIVRTALDLKPAPGKRPADWEDLAPMGVESYAGEQLDALRAGDLAACFGEAFAGLPLARPVTLPGARMKLVHRIAKLDPGGGRFGLGLIVGEADIHPDDWFLTCHFVDDRVMPGTLMYECCLHTLRVYLLRLGWVAEEGAAVLEPVPGVASQLKCRGQVLDTTKLVTCEITIKEIGYRPEPYVIADALMYADGKPIVEISGMSLRYAGATKEAFHSLWADKKPPGKKAAIFDADRILAFAIGKPSEAFGEPYRIFDEGRVIARLPGPPFQFLDRVTAIRAEPWKILPGGECETQYDVPAQAWYFADNRQDEMPFAVLLEIALQPCGWLAAYMGSALTSEVDLSFRNLGGSATRSARVTPGTGTLTVRAKLTRASSSAGMIIQFFDYEVTAGRKQVYKGDTYFGFFPKVALLRQEGLKDPARYQPPETELARGRSLEFPAGAPFPGGRLRMLDRIACWLPGGGPKSLGYIRATRRVAPDEWFFKAHFHQDPVVPGSLGLESFLQLLRFIACERWGDGPCESVATGERHEWVYRGQVIPADREVTVEAIVTAVDEGRRLLRADGYLSVDGRVIYGMKDFSLRHYG
jgi:acyl transferase domain-containing protein/3-hydroxymyristoyl/3-hydroxydecanoyl-(acyl carrier protein) dehydratase